ncbi:MAG: hypothetical protein U1E76_04935 [Planctomycetota bacterium]
MGISFLGGIPDIQGLHEVIGSLAQVAVLGTPSIENGIASGALTFEGLALTGSYMCWRDGTHSVQVNAPDGELLPPPFTSRDLHFEFVVRNHGSDVSANAVHCQLFFRVRAPSDPETLEKDWSDLESILGREATRAGYIVDYFMNGLQIREQEIVIERGVGGARCVTLRSAPKDTAIHQVPVDTSDYDKWARVFHGVDAQLGRP